MTAMGQQLAHYTHADTIQLNAAKASKLDLCLLMQWKPHQDSSPQRIPHQHAQADLARSSLNVCSTPAATANLALTLVAELFVQVARNQTNGG